MGWHLVEHGSWQVSVAPDGLLMLPRHLHPDEVNDFVRTIQAAAPVGKAVIVANETKTTPAPAVSALHGSVYVTPSADPTPGVKMRVTPRTPHGEPQKRAATIGRPKVDRRQPTPTPTPSPQIPGGRRGRTGR